MDTLPTLKLPKVESSEIKSLCESTEKFRQKYKPYPQSKEYGDAGYTIDPNERAENDLTFMSDWSKRSICFLGLISYLCFSNEEHAQYKSCLRAGKFAIDFLDFPSIKKQAEALMSESNSRPDVLC